MSGSSSQYVKISIPATVSLHDKDGNTLGKTFQYYWFEDSDLFICFFRATLCFNNSIKTDSGFSTTAT